MSRALLIAAAFGLAACAASPPADEAPDPNLAFALGSDLSCNAGDMRRCPAGGCAEGEEGEAMTTHISLHVPDRGGAGRFCIATGCEDAQFEPKLTRALGWSATMRTDDRTNYAADLENLARPADVHAPPRQFQQHSHLDRRVQPGGLLNR